MKKFLRQFVLREIWLAILFCLILIALLIATAGGSQVWIYQGF